MLNKQKTATKIRIIYAVLFISFYENKYILAFLLEIRYNRDDIYHQIKYLCIITFQFDYLFDDPNI